jgi:hypothetical protein
MGQFQISKSYRIALLKLLQYFSAITTTVYQRISRASCPKAEK